jgi:thiamine pyrophosphokinase
VIGDEDSLPQALQKKWRAQKIPFCTFPTDKSQTDLELAFLWAQERGVQESIVCGALGQRLDHAMANIALLADVRFASLSLTFVHGGTRVRCLRSTETLLECQGERVSLLSVSQDTLLTLRGFQYLLEREPLLSPTHGISNCIVESPASIVVHEGAVLMFHASLKADS